MECLYWRGAFCPFMSLNEKIHKCRRIVEALVCVSDCAFSVQGGVAPRIIPQSGFSSRECSNVFFQGSAAAAVCHACSVLRIFFIFVFVLHVFGMYTYH